MPNASSSSHSSADQTGSRSANQHAAIQLALKKNLQEERIRDAELAMKQMFEREVATVKTVMGYLFDIGSTNLIDKHISLPYIKEPLHSIAKLSRPAFRFLAAKWFLANGSNLIANWLLTLVVFDPPQKLEPQQPKPQQNTQSATEIHMAVTASPYDQFTTYSQPPTAEHTVALQTKIQQKSAEVTTLQKKMRLTASLAMIMTAILGSMTIWLSHELQQIQLKLETTTLTNCQKP